ncbi:uncharacterized protein DS421_9g262460 [Arachis hypogaea]|nr:uncharacterized protein DS421_9g262460 [Arachis hypogaea]
MVKFEHDWSLVSALIERWRPESHTFRLPCGEMTITLQDVAYQLELKIDSDPVSGCIGRWEQHHQGRTIEELCEQILGVVFSPENRQSQTKWTVKLTWFHNTVCGELEQEATEECLMRYTRGYIMQLIGSILFPDTSDSRVHIRWLPLLEDLDMCGWLSWGLGVLASRWVQYRSDNATGENRLRQYKCTLYKIGMLDVKADASAAVVCSLLCFAIVEWHQVDQVVRQFGVLQHIPTRPLNINDMHRLDGTFGCDKWFPQLLSGWHEMWDARADHRLLIYHYIDLRPSLPYMTWYLQWAHTELFGLDDGHLPELRLAARGGRGRGGGSQGRGRCGRGRGRQGPDEVPRERDPVSTPAHGAEDAGQTVGSVSGPVPGDYCL